MHVLNLNVPIAGLGLRKLALEALRTIWHAMATASGHTALDSVEIPDNVREVTPRTRRLVRQGRISPW